ncbi:MAG: sigma-54-dependent Fis family transcriptional regulator, partial [Phycisphaerae bacterium]|nr:sigma-54-dependent Fis family transcriptional regulator [Phycisphaerae bacterium]
RRGDIAPLADHFLRLFTRNGAFTAREISPDAMDALVQYNWPGNVRELQNVIERAVVLDADEVIRPEHLALRPSGSSESDSDEIVYAVGRTVAEMERRLILKTLQALEGNRGRTAEMLQISVRTLRNKLNQYRVQGQFVDPKLACAS